MQKFSIRQVAAAVEQSFDCDSDEILLSEEEYHPSLSSSGDESYT